VNTTRLDVAPAARPVAGSSSALSRLWVLLLGALAYLPPLSSAPGRMPSDTKLYLYLNPDRLISDAIWMWEPRQFGGWVPHQTVGYLWPAGPWYWLFEHLGVPDWIAHRLWIGTILFAASTGMRWCAKQLGLANTPALIAGLAYGLSPFLLAYVGRTSGLLLPWAGLGWMLGIIVRATKRPASSWREPAQLALVIACLGGLNATAVILISPPLLLWLADSVARRVITPRRCAVLVGQVTLLATGVSLWWMGGLVLQGKYGANVLAYSETLDSVTFTATGSEVLRGVGYWLFYVVERSGPLTVASEPYQTSTLTIAVSFAVVLLAIVGLLLTRSMIRRFAGWCLLAGVVIAVGVHPISDPSPLMSLVANHATSSWALAFRSSTRAVPVILVALSLGIGLLAGWIQLRLADRPILWTRLAQICLAGLLIANLPALWNRQLVNPSQSRDQDVPQAWEDAADSLDADIDQGGRVLQLPGTEFGVHRWGNLVDPLLPGITDRPIITRDLVPVGSPGAMDLLYALDDRVQDGTLEPSSLAPIARLLGVDDVLLTGDVAYERYRTRHPVRVDAVLDRAADVGPPVAFGEPVVNQAESVLDASDLAGRSSTEPLAPVSIRPIADPVPIDRVKERSVLVVGSGMGLVDAAAAGLIDGTELIRYSASDPAATQAPSSTPSAPTSVIITDTNRKQAHQWRGSRDVSGMTEDIGPAVLDADLADHRLPVFPDLAPDRFTTASQRGPVTARASDYGDPITYRPEDRAFFVLDGDPSTAWRVADRGEPVGERIRLDVTDGAPLTRLTVIQDQAVGAGRWITAVRVRTPTGTLDVALDDTSRSAPGQLIELPAGSTLWAEVEITATSTGPRPVYPELGPVGFGELRLDDRTPTEEVVVLSSDTAAASAAADVSMVMTRWRAGASDPVRSDPEQTIEREWTSGSTGSFGLVATARLAARPTDEQLATLLGFAVVPTTSASLPGAPRTAAWAAFDGDESTGWVSVPGDQTPSVGLRLTEPQTIDALDLTMDLAVDRTTPTTVTVLADGFTETLPVTFDDAGRTTLSFGPVTTTSIAVQFSVDTRSESRDLRTGEPVVLPIAVRELTVGDVAPLVANLAPATCRNDLISFRGEPVSVLVAWTLDAVLDRAALPVSTCEPSTSVEVTDGVQRLSTAQAADVGIDIDQIVLQSPVAVSSPVGGDVAKVKVLEHNRVSRSVEIGPCPTGCWLVHGEGWNPGWTAAVRGGGSLGDPQVVDGGFNGWWMPPSTTKQVITLRWTPQSVMWPFLGLSVLTILICCVIGLRRRDGRRVAATPDHDPDTTTDPGGLSTLGGGDVDDLPSGQVGQPVDRPSTAQMATLVIVTALVVSPQWVIAAVIVAGVAWLLRRANLIGWCGLGIVAAITAFYLWRVHQLNPFPGYGWVVNIDEMHHAAMFAVVAVATGLSGRGPIATDLEAPSESLATSTRE
jgi:arabinofuranan 3-O-arabinosyltransferase